VDQRRRLQGLAGRLPGQPRPRQLVQVGIDERQEVRRRLGVARLRGLQDGSRRRFAWKGQRQPSKKWSGQPVRSLVYTLHKKSNDPVRS
jgi:hypothetical protein